MIGRISVIAAALALGAGLVPAAAQTPSAPDSLAVAPPTSDTLVRPAPHQLAPMVITAERAREVGILAGIRARNDIRALERENRALRRTVARQGEEIDRLETRLSGLQQQESRMIAQIAGIDSATAATRARREHLEARLRTARERGTVIRPGNTGGEL